MKVEGLSLLETLNIIYYNICESYIIILFFYFVEILYHTVIFLFVVFFRAGWREDGGVVGGEDVMKGG